ncbi:MAG: UDP-N-acetylmuramoyl-L-alanine--D-glutamate ligase [Planctomycetes bacterium]|nr:UDP-N-acetylmuramoyl-L-alanine--D-glutamate ligase [Planctomycetota bacterium]
MIRDGKIQLEPGARVTVWGLGSFGGGASVVRRLLARGAVVTVTDLKPRAELQAAVDSLADCDVRWVLGEHREADLLGADLVVRNPAIPPSVGWIRRIREAGVPQTSEVALALQDLRVPYVMVTGSKGKTTTATLAGAMLGAGCVAGNNEHALSEVVDGLAPGAQVVLEVSSFMAQLLAEARAEGVRFPAPAAVAITSLEPEHLNWHGGLADYYGAKLSLLDLGGVAVAPTGHAEVAAQLGERPAQWVSTEGPGEGVVAWLEGGAVWWSAEDGRPLRLFARDELRLIGAHNLANALLGVALARALGASPEEVAAGARGFTPLAHRLEVVAVDGQGVRYVNDSTATTPSAAIASLRAVGAPAVLIAGGSDKGVDYAPLGVAAAEATAVVCLGEIGERIAEAAEARLREAGTGGRVLRAATFEEAFRVAREACPPGGTVLLAPGTASYDMFANFKARGERFRALAEAASRGQSGVGGDAQE